MRFFVLALLGLMMSFVTPAFAYKYIHPEGEFSLELPDAPDGQTIWAHEQRIHYLTRQPKHGVIGEYAIFSRKDVETGDFIDIKIVFVKADREQIVALTQEKMKQDLADDYKDIDLQNVKYSFSAGKDTLKWAILSGSTVNKDDTLISNASHYLVGTDTITVIQATYTTEDKKYDEYYKKMVKSISYIGK